MSRSAPRILLAFLIGFTACKRPDGDAARKARPRNVVLFTLDTVRADHLGSYGYARAQTPNLDRLARDGVRFEQAMSAVPLTLPSHATILSGTLPTRHSLHVNGFSRLPATLPTLATRLLAEGYQTGAVVASFVLDRRYGLDRGFQTYDDEIPRDPSAGRASESERGGRVVVDRALAILDRFGRATKGTVTEPTPTSTPGAPSRSPFLLWIHLYDAHTPYDPPEPYRTRHKDSPYDGEIAHVDAEVGRVLDELARLGLERDTVVAVVGDHGESLSEHGELTHGLLVYESTLRVPFLIRAPGILRGGRTVATPVSLADVTPTLLGLLGFAAEARREDQTVEGRDLSTFVKDGVEPPSTDLYAESDYARDFGWSGLTVLRRGRLKYIQAPSPELFDLSRDPGERTNLLRDSSRRTDLEDAIARFRTIGPAHGSEKDSKTPSIPSSLDAAEARARLQSLGYLTGKGAARLTPSEENALPDPKNMVGLWSEFELASRESQTGQLAEAGHRLGGLVEKDPRNPVFRTLLAEVLRRLGDRSGAIALYREAVALAPSDPDVRYDLGVTLSEAGRAEEALLALDEAYALAPNRPDTLNAMGIALASLGRMTEALAKFDAALRLDPRDARPYNNRGNALRATGALADAEEAYRNALVRAPKYAEALNGLAAVYISTDRVAEALLLLADVIEIDPSFHEARLNMGIAYESSSQDTKAAAAYREFLKATEKLPAFSREREIARRLLIQVQGKIRSTRISTE